MSKISVGKMIRFTLKIILPILCVAWLAFIFGNSLRTAEQSSAQSSVVVDFIQDIAQEFAPDSWIATAEGAEYDRLHRIVRKCAHFIEYMVLGGLLCWCYFAYADSMGRIWIPLLGIFLIPFIDEGIQSFSSGRANAVLDSLTDIGGGILGFAFAWGVVLIIQWTSKKIKERKQCKNKV